MTAERPNQCKGKVLVVDDDLQVATFLQAMLKREGYYVQQATRFSKARTLMDQELFDLVTLDLIMPEVDGFDALKWTREHHPDVGVVMATGVEDMDTVIEAMRLGAYDYLLKPFKRTLVTAQIDRAMERQRLLAENRAYQADLEKKVAEQTHELRVAYANLERKVRELEGRDRLLHVEMSAPTLKEACREILQVFVQVLGIQSAVIYRPNAAGNRLEPVSALGLSHPGRLENEEKMAELAAVAVDAQNELVAQVFRQAQLCYGSEAQAAIPLVYQKVVIGALWIDGLEEEEKGERGNALWSLGREAALALWAAQITEDLKSGKVQVEDLLEME